MIIITIKIIIRIIVIIAVDGREGGKYNTTYQRFVCKICTCTILPDIPPLDLLPLWCLDDSKLICVFMGTWVVKLFFPMVQSNSDTHEVDDLHNDSC